MKADTFTSPDIIFTSGYTYSEYLLKVIELANIDYIVFESLVYRIGRVAFSSFFG